MAMAAAGAAAAPKVRAVGVAGAPGQAYTVYGRNWVCTECKADNFPSRSNCFRCRAPRPAGSAEIVAASNASSAWREALDVTTRQIYYWNTETRETSWTRPEELGPAPYATGYYGRGVAGDAYQKRLAEKLREWLQRPARKQSKIDPKKLQVEAGTDFNIWYGRYLGDKNVGLGKEPAPTRCYPDTDAGYTKADSTSMERAYFCLYFARGCCSRGHECTYYHHIPTAEEDGKADVAKDVFGRERFASHRDDMGGIGSFESDCRTLYVGNIKKVAGADMEAIVRKHFEEWGEIENINFINRLSIAFVRYRCRSNTEFAREAMTNQALDSNEVLNVRWAYDDPNPVAKEANKRANADAALAALLAKGYTLGPRPEEMAALEAGVYADGQIIDPTQLQEIVAQGGEATGEAPAIAAYPSAASGHVGNDAVPDAAAAPPKLESYEVVPAASESAAAPASAGSDAAAFLQNLARQGPSATTGAPAPAMNIPPPPADFTSHEYAAWYYTYYTPYMASVAINAGSTATAAETASATPAAAAEGTATDAAATAGVRRARDEEEAHDAGEDGSAATKKPREAAEAQ